MILQAKKLCGVEIKGVWLTILQAKKICATEIKIQFDMETYPGLKRECRGYGRRQPNIDVGPLSCYTIGNSVT